MFGLAERGRLAMYQSTLRQAQADASQTALFHNMGLMMGVSALGEAAKAVAGKPVTFQLQPLLAEIIASVPSAHLSHIDAMLLHAIKPPQLGEDRSGYQMATLINGLVFVRVVEVSRPSLTAKAHAYRSAALEFMQPLYSAGMQMMLSSAHKSEPKSELAADLSDRTDNPKIKLISALKTLGIELDDDEIDNDDVSHLCIAATIKLTRAVMDRAGSRPKSHDEMDAFIGGLFAFAFADLLTQKLGGNFEIVAAIAAPWVVKGTANAERQGAFVNELIRAFNGPESQSLLLAAGRNLDALLRNPSGQGFDRLAGLFQLSRQHAA